MQLRECPFSCHERATAPLLLFLPHPKLGFVLARRHTVDRKFHAKLVAVAVVFAIHEDPNRKAWRDVALTADAYREGHVRIRHCNEALDMSILESVAILFDSGVAGTDLDVSVDLLQLRHFERSGLKESAVRKLVVSRVESNDGKEFFCVVQLLNENQSRKSRLRSCFENSSQTVS